jgi:hypothetical protein
MKHWILSPIALLALVFALTFPTAAPAAPPAASPAPSAAQAPLRKAQAHLREAAHDFGGHREDALKATDEAIHQLQVCLQYDK